MRTIPWHIHQTRELNTPIFTFLQMYLLLPQSEEHSDAPVLFLYHGHLPHEHGELHLQQLSEDYLARL